MVETLLARLRHHLVYMCDLAEKQVDTAVMALVDANPAFAKQVLDGEEEMDALDLQVSRIAQDILAKIKPEGESFRFTIAAMRAAASLEQVGNIANDTAFQAQRTQKNICVKEIGAFEDLVEASETMVRDAVKALVDGDAESAWETIRFADKVDKDVAELLDACERDASGDAQSRQHLVIAVLDLKRIAEHAVLIAEEVVYMVEGRLLRHAARMLLKGMGEPKTKI